MENMRYPNNYHYWHHQYSRGPFCRGRYGFFSHAVALGIGLWMGGVWTRRHDDHWYWRRHFDRDYVKAIEEYKARHLNDMTEGSLPKDGFPPKNQ